MASCAPYANRPPAEGSVTTLADGIAVKRPGTITAPLVAAWLDDVVTVEEDDVADAMVLLMERAKLLVEGGGAVGVAALLTGGVTPERPGTHGGHPVGRQRGPRRAPGPGPPPRDPGRATPHPVRPHQRPARGLARLLTLLSEHGANLVEVEHMREGVSLHVRETGVHVVLEVRDREHAEAVITAARAAGYDVAELTR